jgi:HAD superfamily hydrolase (TIGR01509 family)
LVHPTIQNLIFDLGGVILDLHFDRTHEAFARAGRRSVEEIRAMMDKSAFFNDYEKGLLSDDEFRASVRKMLQSNLSDDEIDVAWNAMLGAIPQERLQLLNRLRSKFRVFLLSNTNSIHLDYFGRTVTTESGEPALGSFFEKAYYSHLLKMRKPDKEIFEHVLKQHQLVPEFTLFLDDNLANLQGARETGIKTFHVQHPDRMMELFS